MVQQSSVPVLQVKDLRTHLFAKRGVVKAVDGVSFSLHGGETLGIVGESGSGKSMLALSIVRLLPQPAGRIVGGSVHLEGEDLLLKTAAQMRAVRGARIGMILQDPQSSLNPVFTVGSQLREAFRLQAPRPRAELQRLAVQALREVQIAAPELRVHNYPHEMSGGMKQRVVGAIGIARSPALLIADEPTTSLDVTIQAQYLRLLRSIKEATGTAIIFITHDFGIVARMCDRVAVMYAGRIVESGPVRAIFDRPAHPYTRALIQSVPSPDRRVGRLTSIEGQPPLMWELPPGCPFAPRCPSAMAKCREVYPSNVVVGSTESKDAHTAACHLLEASA